MYIVYISDRQTHVFLPSLSLSFQNIIIEKAENLCKVELNSNLTFYKDIHSPYIFCQIDRAAKIYKNNVYFFVTARYHSRVTFRCYTNDLMHWNI